MKIKKSDLTHLIESYINEQMSVSVGTDGGAPSDRYPEYVTTANQKQQHDLMMTAKRRAADHPESEAGLRWPQDFVILEEQFEQHIADWKLFKREYPKSSFVLQLFDLSGVSSYGDLAESIEELTQAEPSIFSRCIFGINILAASPIGMIMGLFSGRLGLKVLNGTANAVRAGETNGLKILGELMKGSGRFGDLATPETIRAFFNNPQIIAALEKTGIEVTETITELCVLNFSKFIAFIDSFGFRAFMRTFMIITKNLSEQVNIIILEWLVSESGQEFIKTSKLARWLFEKIPEDIINYLDADLSS